MLQKKICIFMLVGCLALSAAGCGKQASTDNTDELGNVTTTDTYPQKSNEKLTYWVQLHEHVSKSYKSLNETPFAKGLIEATGINVEFVHPPQGQELERFNLMIASDEMTDIVEFPWTTYYTGGVQQAIKDNVIYKLNSAIEKVSPNFRRYLNENPEIDKAVRTDDGSYYMYPMIRQNSMLTTFEGCVIRKDLLDKVKETELPQTIGDWDRVLYKFKAAGVKCPLNIRLSALNNVFGGLFDVQNGEFYVEDGKVKYGAYSENYQEMLKMLAKWYKDGILDKEFMVEDPKRLDALVTNGEIGIAYGSGGGSLGLWIPTLKDNMPSAELVPISYPVNNRGEKPRYGQSGLTVQPQGAAISKKSKNLELAARLLDYGYSEAGHNYYNFGTEGVSYEMKDGIPTYLPSITDKAQNGNVSIGVGISRYARASYFGPFVQDVNYIMQYYQSPVQKQALKIWSDTDAQKYLMPNVSLTLEESNECSKIMNDVKTYLSEKVTKYINGQQDVNNMTDFYDGLKKMGIEKAISIYQAAYDRYQAK